MNSSFKKSVSVFVLIFTLFQFLYPVFVYSEGTWSVVSSSGSLTDAVNKVSEYQESLQEEELDISSEDNQQEINIQEIDEEELGENKQDNLEESVSGTWSVTQKVSDDEEKEWDKENFDNILGEKTSSIIKVSNAWELVQYYISWDISSELNSDNTTNNATFNRTVRFVDDNNLEATLFAGTKISTKSGNSFDLLALELIENPWDKVDLNSAETLVWSTKFGIDGQYLVFSKPVELKIPINWVENGESISIEVKHEWDEEYNSFGLTTNPDAICSPDGWVSDPWAKVEVVNGFAIVYTCGASSFTATYIWWANTTNLIDNETQDFTRTVSVGNLPIWATISDINIIIDFQSIDGTDPTNPGTGDAYSSEVSFSIVSPFGTEVVLIPDDWLANWVANRVVYTFDDTAAGIAPDVAPTTDGTFQPTWSLALLNGETPFGDWILRAWDSAGDDWVILFQFDVEINANDAPTDIELSSNEIIEWRVIGTLVGELSTVDPDIADTHTFSLSCDVAGVDDGSFSISGINLNSAEVFDYDVKSSYDICIRVTDGAASYDENFTISINSSIVPAPVINNNLPVITSTGTSFNVGVWETFITTVSSSDIDTSNVVMQYGTTNVTGSNWSSINHSQMCSPVVVSSSRNDVNGLNQSVVRVNNKATNSFDIKVDNQAGSIPGAQISQVDWIVTNSGAFTFTDDNDASFQIQAGSQLTEKMYAKVCRSWDTPENISFSPAFSAAPVVIHSISSNNGVSSVASTVTANNGSFASEPTATEMWFMLQEALGLCTNHAAENIDYIAMNSGHYTFGWDEIDAVKSSDTVASVTNTGNPVSFASPFSSIPQTILVALSAGDGSDWGHANVHTQGAITTTNFPATIDEDDNIAGTSRTHTTETVAAVSFEKNNWVITQPNVLTYSISGGADAAFFEISSTGWTLSFISAQDWANLADANSDATYEVEVQVCDSHCSLGCDTQSITVEVNSVPTDISLSWTGVDEWASIGTLIGTLSTTDINISDTHNYSLVSWTGDTDNASFTISWSTLSINESPDYVTQSSYDIRIQTDDGRGWLHSKNFTIYVTDIDNEAPVITITAPTKLSNASITNTTIVVTDNVGINAWDVLISWSWTVTASALVCTQSGSTIVNCTISIDDSWNLVISATDIAWNPSVETESWYFLDTIAPNVPSVSVNIDAPQTVDTPEISFSALDNLAVDRFTITYNSDNTWVWIGGSVTIDPATSPVILNLDPDESVHTIIVTVYDTAWNSSSSTVIFPPNITFSAPTTISGSTIMNSTVTVNNPSGNDVSNIILSPGTTNATLWTCTGSGSDLTEPYNNPVSCLIHNISTSGTITVSWDDAILWATGMNSQSYIIDEVGPNIVITAPTTFSGSSITNTTIRITDAVGILSANVSIWSWSTTTSSNYNCTQTNISQVDCTIQIDSSWDLYISANDTAGNNSVVSQLWYIIDTVAPNLALNGSGVLNIAQWWIYNELGASCSDNIDASCSAIVTWSVNTNISGAYTLSYDASDVSWNAATTITRTVNVIGAAVVISEVEYDPTGNESEGEWFELFNPTGVNVSLDWWTITEGWGPSYTFWSWVSIPASGYLLVVNDTTEFNLKYPWVTSDIDMQETDSPNCFNDAECLRLNNTWDSLILTDAISTVIDTVEWEQWIWSSISWTAWSTICRTEPTDNDLPTDWSSECVATPWDFNAVDNIPADIILNGSWTITLEIGDIYTDLWAIYSDNLDGTGSIVASWWPVVTSSTGSFTLTYDYTDSAGNISTQVIRTVNVLDTTIPVITLIWTGVTVVRNASYTDSGAMANDNLDGDITGNIVVNNTVDTSWLWAYTITYNVTDASGNIASEVTRTVTVVLWDTPLLSLVGSWTVSIEQGSIYTDLGAIYSDTEDGTWSVVWSGVVDSSILGTYTYLYDFTDSSWNIATQINRTINVIDTVAPWAPSITSPTSWQIFSNNTPTLTGTGEANSIFEVRNGSWVLIWSGNVDAFGNYSFMPNLDLPQGVTTFSVNLIDASGNVWPATSVTFIIDIEAPLVIISAPTKLLNTSISDTTIIVTDNLWVDAANISVGTGSSAAYSSLSCTQSGALQVNCSISVDDSGTLVINAVDWAGNVGGDSEMGYVIDTIAPNVPSISVNTDGIYSVDSPFVTFSALDNVAVDYFTLTYNSNDTLSWSIGSGVTIDPATSGFILNLDPDEFLHIVTVTVYDSAGNSSSSTIQFPPSVTFNAPTTLSWGIISDSTVTINNPSGNDISNISLMANTTNATLGVCTGSGSDMTTPYATPVTCVINNITGSGTITVSWDDASIWATGMNSQSYIIDNAPATIVITAPTKLSWTGITNTSIEIIDDNGILAGNVVIWWTTTSITSNFSCIQTNVSTVDCIVQIDSSWNLNISATDNAWNISSASENNYIIDVTAPIITLSGSGTITLEIGDSYTDLGAKYSDAISGTGNIIASGGPINTSSTWSYLLTYDYSDSAWNAATQVTRTVNVIDTTPPVITLNWLANIAVLRNTLYVDLGAEYTDNLDPSWTLSSSWAFDISTVGIYILTYDITDASWNAATTVTRTIQVVAGNIPEIVFNGNDSINTEFGLPFVNPGVTAKDLEDGDITASLISSGSVNTWALWTYYIEYDVQDSSLNDAVQAVRTVNVVDTTPATLTLNGSWTITLEVWTPYNDLGANFVDLFDGTWSVIASWVLDVNTVGSYTLNYNYTDSNSNISTQISRTVNIVDTTIPVISLSGVGSVDVEAGTSYIDTGAEFLDNYDGTGSVNGVWIVNSNAVWVFELTYDYTDTSWNTAAQVTRTVNVVDTTPAIISLVWASSITLEIGDSYSDLWAEFTDFIDGTWSLVATGWPVTTSWTGSFTLSYDYTDVEWNVSTQVTRIVNVVDTTIPTITLNGSGTVVVEAGAPYIDAGAVYADNLDGTWSITAVWTVDTSSTGSTILTYDYTDTSSNVALQVTRTVNVVDTTPAIISLVWASSITLEIGDSYSDLWAEFTDFIDGTWSLVATGWPVTTSWTGSFTLSYDYTDVEWNVSTQVTRIVNVVDTTIPTITLNGSGTIEIFKNATYTDPGATAGDNLDGDISANIVVVNPVDTSVINSYTVTYNVSDISGNTAIQVTRTVNVIAGNIPTIILNGSGSITQEVGSPYSDLWAIYTDIEDGSWNIIASGSVNINTPGEYTLYYDYIDSSDNAANQITRTVRIVDTTIPTILLNGSGTVTVEAGALYVDEWAEFIDNLDGTWSIVAVWTVDTSSTGSTTLTYDYTDANNNAALQITRTVNVVDTTSAVIALIWSGSIILEIGDNYIDSGAEFSDFIDGTWSLVATGWPVTTSSTGSFILTYNYTDSSWNIATPVSRTVEVIDTAIPTISLNGSEAIDLEVGSSYVDLWAIFIDNVQGTGSIVWVWAVDTSTLWEYTLSYNFTDSSGNQAAQVTRTINIVDTTNPTITLNGSSSIILEVGDSYSDAWAIFSDNYDGTWNVVAAGWPVTTSSTGSFTLTYDYTDTSGNIAAQITRLVRVVDNASDTDGDWVPDVIEIEEWTNPSDGNDYLDTDRDMNPNYLDSDDDGDGTPDSTESSAPNNGDFNNDGTPDTLQKNVATRINPITSTYTSLAVWDAACWVNNFDILSESNLSVQDEDFVYPIWLLDFEIECTTPGSTAEIQIYLDSSIDSSSFVYKKFDSLTEIYTDISSIVSYRNETVWTSSVIVMSYDITDGDSNDEDGVVNGTIIDPSGPGVSNPVGGWVGTPGWRSYVCRDPEANNYEESWFSKPELCEYTVDASNPEDTAQENEQDTNESVEENIPNENENVNEEVKQEVEEITPEKWEDYIMQNDFASCDIIRNIQNPLYQFAEDVFSDISLSAQRANILKFAQIGIVDGYEDGTFGPSNEMTRTEFLKVALISHCYEYQNESTDSLTYTDIDKSSWQAKVIKKAESLWMINGDIDENGNSVFRPNDVISKAEAVKILMRLSLIDVNNPVNLWYTDITTSWHEKYVITGETLGLFDSSRDNGRFYPDSWVQRSSMIELVDNLVQLYK